jgi:predicted RNA binding protein YcfA (HicA-like mRNA interferase family)
MPKLKRLSGKDVIKVLSYFGFEQVGHRGSHVKLKRVVIDSIQTLTIPMHKELDKGRLMLSSDKPASTLTNLPFVSTSSLSNRL